jgi:hypothetical protein
MYAIREREPLCTFGSLCVPGTYIIQIRPCNHYIFHLSCYANYLRLQSYPAISFYPVPDFETFIKSAFIDAPRVGVTCREFELPELRALVGVCATRCKEFEEGTEREELTMEWLMEAFEGVERKR